MFIEPSVWGYRLSDRSARQVLKRARRGSVHRSKIIGSSSTGVLYGSGGKPHPPSGGNTTMHTLIRSAPLDQLVAYRSAKVTADTAEALRQLELAGKAKGGVRFEFGGVHHQLFSWAGVEKDAGPTGLSAPLSMRPTGREVYLRADLIDYQGPERGRSLAELSLMWALAVPLGFIPFSRYPVPGPTDRVFHYLGPWASLGDFLQGDGRGDLAWPSMVSAAQCAVGTWEGERISERSVQTHLHRLGIHCGPVDGLIGERTLSALRSLGLGGLSMHEAIEALQAMRGAPAQKKGERRLGHFSMAEGDLPEAFSSGLIHTIKTRTGFSVSVDGPGRLILLFGET